MTTQPPWRPSDKEQHFLWYVQGVTRYVIGGGGLIWAMLTDHLDPVLLLVLGSVATSTDVFGFVRDLIRTAKEEKAIVEQVLREEERKVDSKP